MNELNTHCNIGSTTLDQMEIETIRTKLTAVFYKNFPHLKPVVDTRGKCNANVIVKKLLSFVFSLSSLYTPTFQNQQPKTVYTNCFLNIILFFLFFFSFSKL